MTPDEIAKMIPDEVVKALQWSLRYTAAARMLDDNEVREAIAAALAAWPGALCAPPDSWTRHKRDAGSIILPLQETQHAE
jgi:hypothetical protein